MKKISIFALAITFLIGILSVKDTLAQALSLSINPPITELIIQPGKQFIQTYELTNNGDSDEIINIHLIPFIPADNYGNVDLQDDDLESSYRLFDPWFYLQQPGVDFGEGFAVKSGSSQAIKLVITPPKDADEADYYFTILFSTQASNATGVTETQSKASIGTNILLTISEDGIPDRKAEIYKFSAPLIVDSLIGDIYYNLLIQNTGTAYFKPIGAIGLDYALSKKEETINIAPQNVLAKSSRNVFCLRNEALVECKSKKPFIGAIKATAEFNPDGEGELVSATTTTYVFPFSIILAAIFTIILIKIINKKYKSKAK